MSRDQISKKKKKNTKSIVLHDPTKRHFVIPKPGGASDANSLKGKRLFSQEHSPRWVEELVLASVRPKSRK